MSKNTVFFWNKKIYYKNNSTSHHFNEYKLEDARVTLGMVYESL